MAVHRTILVVDVEGFGGRNRTPDQVAVRDGLYGALERAFHKAGIPWADCHHEDRGDGVFVLAPADVPKGPFVESLPDTLVTEIGDHNGQHSGPERIRLRMALHAGEVAFDGHGATSMAINLTFRLLDAAPLKAALAESPGVLALITSSWFFDEVVRNSRSAFPATYRPVRVAAKETSTVAWICRPDCPFPADPTVVTGSPKPSRTEVATELERQYIDFIKADNATFELFQVTSDREPVGYPFDQFYVVPPLTRRQITDAEADLTGVGTDAANAVAEARRVLLLGGAGAGKTTLLRWLAYTAATGHDQDGPWASVVPFVIPLRRFAETALPKGPEGLLEVAAPMLAAGKPDRWVSDLLAAGRAMLLVDGLDELVAETRDRAKRWMETLVRAYPNARYVLSTRPSAVTETWFVDMPGRIGLTWFDLPPLSHSGLRRIIESWYSAAQTQHTDPVQREWLGNCKTELLAGLAARPQLRTLVSSPLLAALLCWLFRQNNKYLPYTRRELLREALDWLLARWDEAKPSKDVRYGVAVEDELRMTKNEKLVLLERLAASMVRGAELQVTSDTAKRRLERAMTGLRSQGSDPGHMLSHLLVRTGLLREQGPDGKIEFIHRTFRDYLAATDMVKAGEIGTLVDNADKDSWYEVVFMAAAQAREKEVAELLRRLLDRAAERHNRRDREVSDRLQLIAAACLGYADVVDPDQVRLDVQTAVQRLIPPTSYDAAEMLARAGPFVIDLLPGPADLTGPNQNEVAGRVIRTLALVGGEEAWEMIRPFAAMHHSTVVDELLRAWRQFEFATEYASALLSHVDFGDRVLPVRRWSLLPRLHHLKTLRAVKLLGDVALADPRAGQYPLSDIPRLRSLEIQANENILDLEPLTRCRALRTLSISGYSKLTDLSALARCTVADLTLHVQGRTPRQAPPELATLAGAPLRRLAIRHPWLAAGLHRLPDDLPLTELVIGNRAEQRSLLGIERWPNLETVAAHGIPSIAELEALAGLPKLRTLAFEAPFAADDLARLRRLPSSVRVLGLPGVARPVADWVREEIGDLPGVNLRFDGGPGGVSGVR